MKDKYYNVDLSTIYSESDVESKILIPLMKQIGIIKKDSDYSQQVPVRITSGTDTSTKPADIVVKKNDMNFIVIEAKNKDVTLGDDEVRQLDSYAIWLKAPYGILCNGREFVLRAYLHGNQRVFLIKKALNKLDLSLIVDAISDNNSNDFSVVPQRLVADQSESFSTLLRDIHQKIRDIDHLDPTNAFDGWSKLLFMKIYEEKWSQEHKNQSRFSYKRFMSEKAEENASKYITDRFKDTCNHYPKIFGEESKEEIGLSLDVIEEILKLLDGYNIQEIPMDVKGKAYEIFLSSTFRGKGLGQFFTPRQVVNFMVDMVNINISTVLLDPACGTGGFLIKGFQRIKETILKTPDDFFTENMKKTKEQYLNSVKDNHIFGVDAEPRATKTAKMNMIMWGDGENVVRGNGLDVVDINKVEYPFNDKKINLILANPPFGNVEKKDDVLKKYSLYNNYNIKKTECLFIERAINILEPDGELAIVIPDGVLVCENTKWVRQLILKNAKIEAVISLPRHTFTPSGVQTISTSVLYIKKYPANYFKQIENAKTDEEIMSIQHMLGLDNYNVFMGVAKEIGYEPNGRVTKSGVNHLDNILAEYILAKQKNKYIETDFKILANDCLVINISKIKNSRIDARYYWFQNVLKELKFEKVPLKDYIDVKSRIILPKVVAPNDTFSIVSVTNSYGVILDEDNEKKYEVPGSDISRAKKVKEGDIAYNPYRVNVGSIGIVGKEYDDYLISPAYVVFRTKNGLDSQVLCALFKNDFYSLYIDIIGLSSIRTSLSATKLKQILIPKSLIDGDVSFIKNKYKTINDYKEKIRNEEVKMQEDITKILV
jgi:type I restriction enzyme M protein